MIPATLVGPPSPRLGPSTAMHATTYGPMSCLATSCVPPLDGAAHSRVSKQHTYVIGKFWEWACALLLSGLLPGMAYASGSQAMQITQSS
eukprot:scaffold138805_cov24-Tisochrysis_lutea.AAC.1